MGRRVGSMWLAGPRPLRDLGAGLDLLADTGIAYARQRRREHAVLAQRSLGRDVYRDLWEDAAAATGAEVEDLGAGFFRFHRDGTSTRTWMHHTPLDDAVTLRLALDKVLVHRFLVADGLPVPDYREFRYTDLDSALAFLSQHRATVVKPASGASGGSGATAGVGRPSELRRAVLRASRGDTRVLIEQQVMGTVYRLLFLDGELLDVLRRSPPRVRGDGQSTIAQLIEAENRRRLDARGHAGVLLLTVDLDAVLTLARAGRGLQSIPGEGEDVQVKVVTNQNRIEDNETVRDGVSDTLVDQCRRAAELVGIRLAGVDIVTPDISRPIAPGFGAIVEVNGTPGLHYHYQVADTKQAVRVAIPVLEKLLA